MYGKMLWKMRTFPNRGDIIHKLTKEEIIVKCGSGRGTFYVRKDAMENENLPQ